MPVDPLHWIDAELQTLRERSLLRVRRTRGSAQQPALVELEGRPYANFASNDYLGLAADPRLAAAVAAALTHEGWGAGASPLVTGRGIAHEQLEQNLAAFEGTESAILFPSGYAANVGTVAALAGKEDAIYSDSKNHASIIDGCRLSGAHLFIYDHCHAASLREQLAGGRAFRRRLIVTDSVFSMDGDCAPLPALADLAREFNAMLLVDEAHATGVLGENGRGLGEHLGTEHGVHVRVGTLSKALGSAGGFVAGSRSLIDFLANRARSYVFSTASPAAASAAGIEALRIVRAEPHRRTELLARASALRATLTDQGWNVGNSTTQIIPLYVGSPQAALALSDRLKQQGLLVPAIRPPSVPPGESLLRICLSWAHRPAMIERLVDALHEARKHLDLAAPLAATARPPVSAGAGG